MQSRLCGAECAEQQCTAPLGPQLNCLAAGLASMGGGNTSSVQLVQLPKLSLELLHFHAHRALQFAFICFIQRVLDTSVHTRDHTHSLFSYLVRLIEVCCFCILLSIFDFVSSLHKLVVELVYLALCLLERNKRAPDC